MNTVPLHSVFSPRCLTQAFVWALLLCLCVGLNTSYAAEETPISLQMAFDQVAKAYQENTQQSSTYQENLARLDQQQQAFSELNLKLEECIGDNSKKLTEVNADLKLLGRGEASESKDITLQRDNLRQDAKSYENEVKRCNALKIQLDTLMEAASKTRSELLKQQLFNKEQNAFDALKAIGTHSQNFTHAFAPIVANLKQFIRFDIIISAVVAFLAGYLWKRRRKKSLVKKSAHSSPTFVKAWQGIRRTAPSLFLLIMLWLLAQTVTEVPQAVLNALGFALLQTITFAMIRGIIFPENTVNKQNRSRTKLLSLLFITVSFSTLAYALNEPALGRYQNVELHYLAWLAAMLIASISFIMILRNSMDIVFNKHPNSLYLYLPIAVIVALIFAAILGYRNLSSQVFFGLINSLILLFFVYFLLRCSNELFDSLDQGKLSWQSKLRRFMSVNPQEAFPGVVWLRILSFFAMLFFAVSTFIQVWGGQQQPISSIKSILQNGLTVGSLNFDLVNILYALLIIILAFLLSPFIKNTLIDSWLKHSNLSSGAKDATKTLVGYVVIALAFLWALFILGMNFQNLAIVAGALSVGIGFGLQNIVNNFVSGLILLFERPIRRGDWVVVGNTEGYVRDISIRSTKIQTFDKADVIVPNSELISNQVTNLMLNNQIGRIKIAVGVAYGSDVPKVIEILENIAAEHPDVIANQPAYPVRALFISFGDSALNFELRCFVRDVDMSVIIRSDLNIAVDAAFRKENIEIPFPQRVIHTPNADQQ